MTRWTMVFCLALALLGAASCRSQGLTLANDDTAPTCGPGGTCAAPSFCEAKIGECPSAPTAADTCISRPPECKGANAKQPECGCDNHTYPNACERRAAGVSLAHAGACETKQECPSDLLSAEGQPCTEEGKSCGGENCTNVCDWCNILSCTDGRWQRLEAFPKPNCNACEATGGYCDPGDYAKPICKTGFHEDESILQDNPGICGLGICCVPNQR